MKIIVYASIVAWVLASIAVSVMVVLFVKRALGRKKNVVLHRILTLREKKLWICALLTIILMERFVFVYLSVFRDNPATAFTPAIIKQYLGTLLLSLVWPPQVPVVVGSIAILVLNRSRERTSGISAEPARYDRRIFIGTVLAFFLLVTTSFLLLRMNRIHGLLFYSLFLFGKFFAFLAVILSMNEQKENTGQTRQGDG